VFICENCTITAAEVFFGKPLAQHLCSLIPRKEPL
jgi:hypothetical protein